MVPEVTLLPEDLPGGVEETPAAEPPAAVDDDLGHTRSELPDDAYDHLWGATVVKSVEEAAVRDSDEDDEEHAAPPVPATAPDVVAPDEAPAPAPAGFAPPADSTPAPVAASAPLVSSSGLIDGVPDFGNLGAASGSASITGRTVPPLSPAPSPAPTVGAVAPAVPTSAAGVVASPPDDDHDGLTVTVSELEAMRRLGAAAPAAELPASALGRIVLSTGETHPLDRPVIIGRRPRANRVQADQVPVLVAVASPEQDISRNHLEIRLEGRHVLIVDLDTTNGSVLHRDGTPPLRLGPNEPVLALSGDVVDIGDGITVLFEDVP
ncbi:MAG: FHA domain-containing protein [Herbiconiux sp.]|nr:MAG: FHA domain-containing protein [Herbiconiux sp.]